MRIQFDLPIQTHIANELEKQGKLMGQIKFKAADALKKKIIDELMIFEDMENKDPNVRLFVARIFMLTSQEAIDNLNNVLLKIEKLDKSIFDEIVLVIKENI